MKTVVRCSSRFLQSMVLATIESYYFGTGERVRRSGHPAREVYGHVWGHTRIVGEDDPLRFLHLDFLHLQTSASRRPDSVSPNADFLRTSYDIVGRISPELAMLGDFHTHPYPDRSVGDVARERLYEFSEADNDTFHHDDLLWEASGGRPIMTVATVAELKRITETEIRNVDPATCQFDVGRFRIWFRVEGGYTNRADPEDEMNVETFKSIGSDGIHLDIDHRFYNDGGLPISLRTDD